MCSLSCYMMLEAEEIIKISRGSQTHVSSDTETHMKQAVGTGATSQDLLLRSSGLFTEECRLWVPDLCIFLRGTRN